MKNNIIINKNEKIVVMYENIQCDFVCLYPSGWEIESKIVLPSVIHFEENFISNKSRESFDKLVEYNTEYKKVFIIKGVKYDVLIHTYGRKKELIHSEDEVNGVHIMKFEDFEKYLNYKDDFTERKVFKI